MMNGKAVQHTIRGKDAAMKVMHVRGVSLATLPRKYRSRSCAFTRSGGTSTILEAQCQYFIQPASTRSWIPASGKYDLTCAPASFYSHGFWAFLYVFPTRFCRVGQPQPYPVRYISTAVLFSLQLNQCCSLAGSGSEMPSSHTA
jgi:hypothetical protein